MRKLLYFLACITILLVIFYTMNEKYHIIALVSQYTNPDNIKTEQDFVMEVRKHMLNGENEATLRYMGKVKSMEWFTEDAIDKVYNIDEADNSGDYDYLRYKVNSIYAHIIGFGRIITVTYQFEYNETAAQTAAVDEKIKKLYHKWHIEKLNDYEKIKKIHDYIIKNASYDTGTKHYSAYDNLIRKSSTCQGYMSAAYKMFTQAGIPCRIITGKGNKDSHGWNIVKLDGRWYNIDCTWDDPVTESGKQVVSYDFFLKSDKDFKGHSRDESFQSGEFYEEYKVAEKSYQK